MKMTVAEARTLIRRVLLMTEALGVPGSVVNGTQLRKGMYVEGSYGRSSGYGNSGSDVYEILGVSDTSQKYGEGGIKFDSVKDAMRAAGARTLRQLEELESHNEYGHSHYLWVRDVETNEQGPWFYLYEGRWARGSGAEKLSFRLVDEKKYKQSSGKRAVDLLKQAVENNDREAYLVFVDALEEEDPETRAELENAKDLVQTFELLRYRFPSVIKVVVNSNQIFIDLATPAFPFIFNPRMKGHAFETDNFVVNYQSWRISVNYKTSSEIKVTYREADRFFGFKDWAEPITNEQELAMAQKIHDECVHKAKEGLSRVQALFAPIERPVY